LIARRDWIEEERRSGGGAEDWVKDDELREREDRENDGRMYAAMREYYDILFHSGFVDRLDSIRFVAIRPRP
jgi:hypothetical protein